MRKFLLMIALLLPLTVMAEDKFLNFKFNENVVITISNVPCKVPSIDSKKYPYAVLARRVDRQFMFGCFTHDKDDIVIQWAGGDQSKFPANVFLVDHLEPNT